MHWMPMAWSFLIRCGVFPKKPVRSNCTGLVHCKDEVCLPTVSCARYWTLYFGFFFFYLWPGRLVCIAYCSRLNWYLSDRGTAVRCTHTCQTIHHTQLLLYSPSALTVSVHSQTALTLATLADSFTGSYNGCDSNW